MVKTEVTIRPMTNEDLDAVTIIEETAFSMPWSKDGFASALQMPGSNYLVAVEPFGEIVGYCGYYSVLDEAEITNVAIAPAHRKKGYATLMLTELLRQAKSNFISKIVLEVRFSNHNAIALYEKLGFQKLGLRRDFYERPKEDAIIMLLEI